MPPPSVAKGSLKWSLPKGWSEQPGGGTMRFATFKAPFAGKLEATVVVLPGQAGGLLMIPAGIRSTSFSGSR